MANEAELFSEWMKVQCERAGIKYPPQPPFRTTFEQAIHVGSTKLLVPEFFGKEKPGELPLQLYISTFYVVCELFIFFTFVSNC